MPRPPLVLGTWGKISRIKRGTTWVASARFRDFDGVTRKIERQGATGRKAEDALVEHFRDRSRLHGADLSPDTRVNVLGDQWYDTLLRQQLSQQSCDIYRRSLDRHIRPALGALQIREVTVPIVDRFIDAIETNVGNATAKTARVVLNGMFALAARHGATPTNPVRDARSVTAQKGEIHTLDLDEVFVLRERLREWDAAKDRGGRRRATDLADVVDMLLATAMRTGEVLALRWSDLDLAAEVPTVTISATAVHVRGEGLLRQERPKTDAGFRELTLPPFAVRMLLRRHVEARSDWVFPSSVGTQRSPNNMRRQWRDFRGALGYPDWLVPKSCRKTVATAVADGVDLDAASELLGHTDTRTTRRHYAKRHHLAADVRSVTEQFGA